MVIAPPEPKYVGPPKWKGATNNKPITRIVIHATVGADCGVPRAAENTVAYTKRTTRPSSYHYIADSIKSLQLTYDSVVAYHAPPNGHSLGYELCCSLTNKGKGHWNNSDHQKCLRLCAKDVARLCLAYNVPIRKLTVAQTRAGAKGICGHDEVSRAFGQSSHWDPGPYFPWVAFIKMVQNEADILLGRQTAAPANSHDLKFRHISLQWSDTDAETKHDIDLIFSSTPHFITFTEAGKGQNPIARQYIEQRYSKDYNLFFDNFDAAVAVKKTMGGVKDKGYIKVLPGVAGDHPNVGIAYLTVQNEGLGKITLASTHYITKDHIASRKAQNNKIAAELQRLADKTASGPGLFFFGADTNRDDATQDVVPNTRLTTCWDELKQWPDTLKTVTFDVLGSFDDDARVKVKSGRLLVSKFNTDHKPIEAIYNVKEL